MLPISGICNFRTQEGCDQNPLINFLIACLLQDQFLNEFAGSVYGQQTLRTITEMHDGFTKYPFSHLLAQEYQ